MKNLPVGWMIFQPTPPHRGRRHFRNIPVRRNTAFQPTPPHRGRRWSKLQIFMYQLISTHAPTLGARTRSMIANKILSISTPAPTTGATSTALLLSVIIHISTHAPTQGATLLLFSQHRNCIVFQPTPPHRGRQLKSSRQNFPQ